MGPGQRRGTQPRGGAIFVDDPATPTCKDHRFEQHAKHRKIARVYVQGLNMVIKGSSPMSTQGREVSHLAQASRDDLSGQMRASLPFLVKARRLETAALSLRLLQHDAASLTATLAFIGMLSIS